MCGLQSMCFEVTLGDVMVWGARSLMDSFLHANYHLLLEPSSDKYTRIESMDYIMILFPVHCSMMMFYLSKPTRRLCTWCALK